MKTGEINVVVYSKRLHRHRKVMKRLNTLSEGLGEPLDATATDSVGLMQAEEYLELAAREWAEYLREK